jgi:hypothetical protein
MSKKIPPQSTGKTPRPSKARDAWEEAKKKRRNYVEAHNMKDANNIAAGMRYHGRKPAIRMFFRDSVRYWRVYDTGKKHTPLARKQSTYVDTGEMSKRIVAVYQGENPLLPENVQRVENFDYMPSAIENIANHPNGNKVSIESPPSKRYDG